MDWSTGANVDSIIYHVYAGVTFLKKNENSNMSTVYPHIYDKLFLSYNNPNPNLFRHHMNEWWMNNLL